MTQVISRFEELRTAIGGTVVTPDDPGYDEARRVWNADIDRRPEVIAYCTSTEDVAAAVTFARDASLEISVRGGAHSTSGSSVGDAGIVIDLSRMNDVEVDPAARRATVGGGALLRDVDAATQIHGLAVPCGEIGHTGIGGITLGGGMGWLTRRHGLTIDNLLAAQVVLADGRVVRAAADEHPDLFWAIRGGGATSGSRRRSSSHCTRSARWSTSASCSTGSTRPPTPCAWPATSPASCPTTWPSRSWPCTPRRPRSSPRSSTSGWGSRSSRWASPRPRHTGRSSSGCARRCPRCSRWSRPRRSRPCSRCSTRPTRGAAHAYEKSTYLETFSDGAIDVIVGRAAAMVSPMSVVHFYVLGGAYCRPADGDTAFSGGRSPRLTVFIIGFAAEAAGLPAERAWARGFFDALSPHTLGPGRLRQRPRRRRLAPRRGGLRPEVRPPRADQGRVRPGQPVPPQPERPARDLRHVRRQHNDITMMARTA